MANAPEETRWTRVRLTGLLVLLIAASIAVVRGLADRAVLSGERPANAPATQPLAPAAGASVAFLVLGDHGKANRDQARVASAMADKAAADGAEFVLLLGDNFYFDGVTSEDDPQWRETFTEPFDHPSLQIPFHAVLGNHDHKGNVDAQIGWDGDPRWRMPARYSTTTVAVGADELQLFFLDTWEIHREEPGYAEQVAWLAGELAASTARWRVALGHHPLASGGRHGGSRALIREVHDLMLAHGVDLYLAGHDHYLALLTPPGGVRQVISGAGCQLQEASWTPDSVFAAVELGFAWMRVERDALWVQFVDADGDALFTHRLDPVAKPGDGIGDEPGPVDGPPGPR
jgi:acid phosphatase